MIIRSRSLMLSAFLLSICLSNVSFSNPYQDQVYYDLDRVKETPVLKQFTLEVVLVGPGSLLSESLGDLALRIQSSSHDLLYGLTPLSHSPFIPYINFLVGDSKAKPEVRFYQSQIDQWTRRNRTITSYPLQISPQQEKTLVETVERITAIDIERPYEPVSHGAGTRFRGLFDQLLDGALRSTIEQKTIQRSLREELRLILSSHISALFFMELFAGPRFDEPWGLWKLCYRPHTLMSVLQSVQINGRPILGRPRVIHQRKGQSPWVVQTRFALTLSVLFLFCLVGMAMTIRVYFGPKVSIGLVLFALSSGCLGSFSLWLSALSGLGELRSAWTLLLFSPLDLLLLPMILSEQWRIFGITVLKVRVISTLCFVTGCILVLKTVAGVPILLFIGLSLAAILLSFNRIPFLDFRIKK